MKFVNPVFYSYLGLGLKAARLATLGALETEGLFECLGWVEDGERRHQYSARLFPFLTVILWKKSLC
jgi:hypothetical protein